MKSLLSLLPGVLFLSLLLTAQGSTRSPWSLRYNFELSEDEAVSLADCNVISLFFFFSSFFLSFFFSFFFFFHFCFPFLFTLSIVLQFIIDAQLFDALGVCQPQPVPGTGRQATPCLWVVEAFPERGSVFQARSAIDENNGRIASLKSGDVTVGEEVWDEGRKFRDFVRRSGVSRTNVTDMSSQSLRWDSPFDLHPLCQGRGGVNSSLCQTYLGASCFGGGSCDGLSSTAGEEEGLLDPSLFDVAWETLSSLVIATNASQNASSPSSSSTSLTETERRQARIETFQSARQFFSPSIDADISSRVSLYAESVDEMSSEVRCRDLSFFFFAIAEDSHRFATFFPAILLLLLFPFKNVKNKFGDEDLPNYPSFSRLMILGEPNAQLVEFERLHRSWTPFQVRENSTNEKKRERERKRKEKKQTKTITEWQRNATENRSCGVG